MELRTRSLAIAVALAAGLSTAAFADTGVSDNTNAIINGDTNRPAERVMDRSTANSELTGTGRADNTNSLLGNPDDFMRAPRHPAPTYAPVPSSPRDESYDTAPLRSGSGNPVSQGTYAPEGTR